MCLFLGQMSLNSPNHERLPMTLLQLVLAFNPNFATDHPRLFTFIVNHPGLALDRDGDGYTTAVDCDDREASVHPGQQEICDGWDNDCNGLVNEDDPNVVGLYQFVLDLDGDGFGVSDEQFDVYQCPATPPTPAYTMYARTGEEDCDDTNAAVNPYAIEITENGIDEDCSADTKFVVWFDADPGVIEVLPGDDSVYFGSWTMLVSSEDFEEHEVHDVALKMAVSEDPDGNWTSYSFSRDQIAADYLENCQLIDANTGATIGGPIDPDEDSALEFTDDFIVTNEPFTVDLECDFKSLIPPTKLGFGIADNWITSDTVDEWYVEDANGDSVTVEPHGANNYLVSLFTPNLSVELLPN